MVSGQHFSQVLVEGLAPDFPHFSPKDCRLSWLQVTLSDLLGQHSWRTDHLKRRPGDDARPKPLLKIPDSL